jgi:hypothetical protein
MIALTTLGLVIVVAGGLACVWVGSKFRDQIRAIPIVGKLF